MSNKLQAEREVKSGRCLICGCWWRPLKDNGTCSEFCSLKFTGEIAMETPAKIDVPRD
jgi:hypothetical protein